MSDKAAVDASTAPDAVQTSVEDAAVDSGLVPAVPGLQRVQRMAGNRAANRLVQRHRGTLPHGRFRYMPVTANIRALLAETPTLIGHLARLTPDRASVEAPPISNITVVQIQAADMVLNVTPDGRPVRLLEATEPAESPTPDAVNTTPPPPNRLYLVEPATQRLWWIGFHVHDPEDGPGDGQLRAWQSSRGLPSAPPGAEAGQCWVIATLPSFRFGDDPELVEWLNGQITEGAAAARQRAGPPGWSRRRFRQARDRRRRRRGDATQDEGNDDESRDGTDTGDQDGTGLGLTGTGRGGGGTSERGRGTGETGRGTGAATETDGDGRGGVRAESSESDADDQQRETPVPSERPGVDRPMTESERRKRVEISLRMTRHGPAIKMSVDGAVGWCSLREDESEGELDARLDALENELADSRDASKSTRIAGGAESTGIEGARWLSQEEREHASADGLVGGESGTPGPRVEGGGQANTPQWPSRLEMYGVGGDAQDNAPITLVSGASNDAAMIVDRGSDVYNYFQRIEYRWELIDISDFSVPAREQASQSTGAGEGHEIDDGHLRNIERAGEHIWEDFEAEHWAVRVAAIGPIALSAAVSMLGTLISEVVSVLSHPSNERSFSWGTPGEYLLRCIATPVVSDEARADPGRHIIRASSVSFRPVRVMDINERAEELNDAEQNRLDAWRTRLREIDGDPEFADEAEQLRERIRQAELANGEGATARIDSTVDGLQQQVKFCEILTAESSESLLDTAEEVEGRHPELSPADGHAEYTQLLNFAAYLVQQGERADRLLPRLRRNLEQLQGQQRTANVWSREIRTDHRPRVTLVSEENGQAYQLITMLGEASDSRPDDNEHRWIFYDITSSSTQNRYEGTSSKAGDEGRNEAIRNAFVNFRENAEYGRGTIAIRMPPELDDVPIEARMRAAPGDVGRWMSRLEDLATAAEIAALVVATVATGGAAALLIGAAGGIAGGLVAGHRMHRRSTGDRLEWNYETFTDVLAIVGGLVSVIPLGTVTFGAVARRSANTARRTGDVSQFVASSRWVQRVEQIDATLHVFGVVQGVGQVVVQVPYDIMRQMEELERQIADDPSGMSPGEQRARRTLIMLNGVRSGAIGMISLGQSLSESPHVTSDADVWRGADEVAQGPQSVPDASPIPHGGEADPPTAATDGLPDPAAVAADPRVGTTNDRGVRHSDDTAAPRSDGEANVADVDEAAPATTARRTTPTPPPAAHAAHRPIGGASGLVARVNRMMRADRSSAPPTGRISIVEGASFTAATGCPADAFGGVTPSGDIVINGAMLDATPGLAARLERTVIGRGHQTGVRALGDVVGTATLRIVLREVFGGSGGIPARGPDPTGAQAVELLAGAVGFQAILDVYFQGNIGVVRDRLAELFGHGRAEAILDAARAGQTADLARLMEPDAGGLVDTYGPAFTEAVRTGVAGPPDQQPMRRPTDHQRLAGEIADAVGARHLRDAYMSGDHSQLSATLADRLGGPEALSEFTARVRSGDIAGARRQLAESATSTTIPSGAEASVAAFNADGAADVATAERVLGDVGNMETVRKLVDEGSIGGGAADTARQTLQDARTALVDRVLEAVRTRIEEQFPSVSLRLQDLGTVGFTSDRDVTLVAESADPSAPAPLVDLVTASTRAVRDAYEALTRQGYPAAESLDTNFYTELHEGSVAPASTTERQQISADQTIAGITEIAINAPDQFTHVHEQQLAAIDADGMPEPIRREARERVDRQFAIARDRAAQLLRGGRETGLRRARDRLETALGRTPPPSARELRQLMADVKLLEPDAFGTRAAVEGVVHGQQAARRAGSAEELAAARSHMGDVDSGGSSSMTEQLEHRLAQARSALAHLLGHLPEPGRVQPLDVSTVAKQLARVTHAFRESGLSIDHTLVDDAGLVVASKSDGDEAIIREVRGWAEHEGRRFRSDDALMDAYIAEARRLAVEMSARLGTNTEAMRAIEGALGDEGPAPIPDGPDAAATPPTDTSPEMSADRVPSDGLPGTNAAAGQVDDPGAPAAAERPLTPIEVAHHRFMEQLRADMRTPIEAETGRRAPIEPGDVGVYDNPDAAYRAFRDAVARAGEREVGLFFERSSGRYAVRVGGRASVGPPDGGGPWECPIHTHPNPQNVLTYRMPAPQDLLQYVMTALETQRPISAMVEFPYPDGTRGQSRLEVHPDRTIVFEFDGQSAPETLTWDEYQARWDSRTRYVDPDSDQAARFRSDIEGHLQRVDEDRMWSSDGGRTGNLPDQSPDGVPERMSSGDIIDRGGRVEDERTDRTYARREFFAEDAVSDDPDQPHQPRYQAAARLSDDGTMSMDFGLREQLADQEMHRSGSLRGFDEFRAALQHFQDRSGTDAVRRIKGEWGLGDNLDAFMGRYQELLDVGVDDASARLIAASETTTGRWADRVGFGRIADVQIEDGTITVMFEPGASNAPPVPADHGGAVVAGSPSTGQSEIATTGLEPDTQVDIPIPDFDDTPTRPNITIPEELRRGSRTPDTDDSPTGPRTESVPQQPAVPIEVHLPAVHEALQTAFESDTAGFPRELPTIDTFVVAESWFDYYETWRGHDSTRRQGLLPEGPAYFHEGKVYLPPGSDRATIAHETLHVITNEQFFQRLPLWINEGVTEMFTQTAMGEPSANTGYVDNIAIAELIRARVGDDVLRRAYFGGDVPGLDAALAPFTGTDDTCERLRTLFDALGIRGTSTIPPDVLAQVRVMLGETPVGGGRP